ncbi:MAG TPA: DUF4139 domain-containing protein [Polyangiales bacterium]|nr:DUF4139 domain-containing protein [Polyangiales bacterium]
MKRLLLLGIGLAGCATSAVQGDTRLPVRNVVLYRSGVGYFERSGKFSGEALEFRVKQSEVGDFLASLTAVERGAGGVRSIAFDVPEPPRPVKREDPEQPPPEPVDPRVDVKLSFAGEQEHELSVAYVVGSPVWRPSYRVVFDDVGQPLLQAWAVVQNTSGEDWRDVKLTLTTGAPISFRSDLGTPITPVRPLVSDSGEVIDYVPTGETVVAQGGGAPPPPPAPPMAPVVSEEAEADYDEVQAQASAPVAKEYSKRAAPRPAPSISAANLAQSVQTQAIATAVSETVTRYQLAQPVTVPNGGSTMVAIVSTKVSGEQARLFAPEPGVALSSSHPFSVARLRNDTGAVLEKGPISVLAKGSFLGQGVIDTLPVAAQTFVPFALDKSIVVERSEGWNQTQGQLLRVQRGLVTLQQFSQRETKYRLRNGGAEAAQVYVRHPRWSAAELVSPPASTELAPDKALLPIQIAARGEATLDVVERTPTEVQLSVLDSRALDAVSLWLSGPAASDPKNAQLAAALQLGRELSTLDDKLNSAQREQDELRSALDETRQNLKAIEKLTSAKDLRARLYERLKQLDARNAELAKQLIEGRTKRAELEVRLKESLDGVSLEAK